MAEVGVDKSGSQKDRRTEVAEVGFEGEGRGQNARRAEVARR